MIDMADVSFKAEEVKSILTQVEAAYDGLAAKVKEMSEKTTTIDSFWTSDEQVKFVAGVNNVNDMISKFNTKYDAFIALINSVMTTYGNDKASILAALEKELSKK